MLSSAPFLSASPQKILCVKYFPSFLQLVSLSFISVNKIKKSLDENHGKFSPILAYDTLLLMSAIFTHYEVCQEHHFK